jgi:hypothetical protein
MSSLADPHAPASPAHDPAGDAIAGAFDLHAPALHR